VAQGTVPEYKPQYHKTQKLFSEILPRKTQTGTQILSVDVTRMYGPHLMFIFPLSTVNMNYLQGISISLNISISYRHEVKCFPKLFTRAHHPKTPA
jgi:hypothetical protein